MAHAEGHHGTSDPAGEATRLLERLGDGDTSAAGDLLPIVYDELRGMARGYFRGQRPDHTLQPTALVHEAFLRLIRSDGRWTNRSHFCAVAATAMRQILQNHARDRRAVKRGSGEARRVALTGIEAPGGGSPVDLEALDDALRRLEELDARQARIVELWFFGGMTMEEVATSLGVSTRTVERAWRQARAWLNRELDGGGS